MLNILGIPSVRYISSRRPCYFCVIIDSLLQGRTLGLAIYLAVLSVTEAVPLCLNSSKSLTTFFKSSMCLYSTSYYRNAMVARRRSSLDTTTWRSSAILLFPFSRSNLLSNIETLLLDELLSWQRWHKKFKQRGWWTYPTLR